MKLNEINEDKNLINISITLDDDDLDKIKNTVYLFDLASIDPIYSQAINKDNYNQYFNIDETVSRYSNIILNRIKKYLNENTDYDYLIEPINTQTHFESFSSEQPIEFQAVLKPEIELINYKEDLTYPPFEINQDDLETELNEELEALVKHNVRLEPTEKPYEEGNTISADYTLEYNGQSFSDEKNKIIAQEDIPETIKLESLLGKSVGDEIIEKGDFFTTKLKINQIYQPDYPELDDDFASEVSEFDTLDEFKDDLKEKISEQMKLAYEVLNKEENFKKFLKGTQLKDSNEQLEQYLESDNYKELIDKLSLNNYIGRFNGSQIPALENEFDYSLVTLAVEKLLKQEGIDLTDDIEKATKEFLEEEKIANSVPSEAENYLNALKQYKDHNEYNNLVKEVFKDTLNYQKALDILAEYIKEED